MKTLIYNGIIYQGKGKFVKELLIEDGLVVDSRKKDKDTVLLDLQGKCVLPGFNDSHMHLFSLANTYGQAKIRDCSSKKEIIEICRQFIKDNPLLTSKGMSARGYNNDYFTDDKSFLNALDLDQISKDIPIVLDRVCGHVCSCNHKALEMLDEKYGLKNLPNEEIEINANGEYTGLIKENSVAKALSLIPLFDKQKQKELVLKAMNYCVSVGLTSIQCNDIDDYENDQMRKDIIKELYLEHKAPLRYRFQCCFKDYDSLKRTLEDDKYKLDFSEQMCSLGPLKLYKDGSLGARTAQMYEDYADEKGNKGIEVNSKDEIVRYCKLANQYGLQVVTHCIGDKAVDEVAKAYIEANGNDKNYNRHGLIHCQISDDSIMNRIKDGNLLIFYQPIFLEYDLHIVKQRVGERLAKSSYCFKKAKDMGIVTSFGSDCPIEDNNAFYNLHCAINRQDLNEPASEIYNPEECMSVMEAIDAFTYGSAYCEFMENKKGLLDIGYYADLVVIDENIFTMDKSKIKDIKPYMTMVNGKKVYQRLD